MTEIVRPASPLRKSARQSGRTGDNHSGGVFFIGLVAIVILIFLSALNIARIGHTYLTVYPVKLSSIGDPEPHRWAASNYGITHLIQFANESLSAEDRIFSFRQSDFAYYAKNPIAVYTDNAHARLFKIKSPVELRQALLQARIRYIAVPPYGMAEINNSAFGRLIGDPGLARLVFEQDGDRLYELHASPYPQVRLDQVRAFDLGSKAEQDKWYKTQMPQSLLMSLLSSPARLEKSAEGATIRRDRPLFEIEPPEDVLHPWDLSIDAVPFLVGRSDFEVRNGLYNFEGRIAGDGIVNLYAEFYSRTPGGDTQRERKLLWSGVLNDHAQTIVGQFKVLIGDSELESHSNRQSVRLFFGLKQGGFLTVRELSINRVLDPRGEGPLASKQSKSYEKLRRAHNLGWEVLRPAAAVRQYNDPFDVFGMDDAGRVVVKQTTGDARIFASPTYLLPTDLMTSEMAFRMQRTSEGVKPIVEVSLKPSGNGFLSISVTGTCLDQRVTSNTGEPDPDNQYKVFQAALPSVSLRNGGRPYRESVVLDCTPSSMKTVFSVTHDTKKSPPDFRLGEARISDFDMTLNVWAAGQEITEIPLVRSSDVRPPMISPPETQLPDYGQ